MQAVIRSVFRTSTRLLVNSNSCNVMSSSSNYSDDESIPEEKPKKVTKAAKEKKAAKENKATKRAVESDSGDEELFRDEEAKKAKKPDNEWDLGNSRRVSVSKFKGKMLIDIREMYTKDGAEKPGRKGISLSVVQWETVAKSMDAINEYIAKNK